MDFPSSRALAFCAVLILLCNLLQACASSPGQATGKSVSDSLASDNLDLIFATEYPVASKDEALARAAMALRDNEVDKGLFYYVRALQFDPSDADLLARIGSIHMAQENLTLAGRAYQLALRQDPEHAAALEGMGLLYFDMNRFDEAEDMLQQAVARENRLWRSHNILGVLEDQHGNYDIAQQHYDRALEIQPDSPSVMINRGYSKFLSGDMQAAALDLYAVATRHNHPRAWRNLAMVYAKQGWYDEAIETFMEVTDDANSYNETGAIAMENGDYDAALELLNEALRLSPSFFPAAEENLAMLRKKMR